MAHKIAFEKDAPRVACPSMLTLRVPQIQNIPLRTPACFILPLMRTSTINLLVLFVVVLALAGGVSGCAARRAEALAKLPIADSVCLRITGVRDPEQGLLARKVASLLREHGFRSKVDDCDVIVSYTSLDSNQWEIMTSGFLGLRSRTAYRVEGILTVSRAGKIVNEDQAVNLRDYSSKSDVLEALAWEVIGYVIDNYRPAVPPVH